MKFEIGKTYAMAWAEGSFVNIKVLNRSENGKWIWVEDQAGKVVRRKVGTNRNGVECAKPYGAYAVRGHHPTNPNGLVSTSILADRVAP